MYGRIIEVITGNGLGISYSSLNQVGSLAETRSWSATGVKLFHNISHHNTVVKDHPMAMDEYVGSFEICFYLNSSVTNLREAWRLNLKRLKLNTIQKPFAATITLIEEDCHETLYTQVTEDYKYIAEHHADGSPGIYFDKKHNRWIWTHPKTGLIEFYDQEGLLTIRRDSTGKEIHFNYIAGELANIVCQQSGNIYEINRHDLHIDITLSQRDTPKGLAKLLQRYDFDIYNRLIETTIPDIGSITYKYRDNVTARLDEIITFDGRHIVFNYQMHPITRLSSLRLNGSNVSHFDYQDNDRTVVLIDGSITKRIFKLDPFRRIKEIWKERGFHAEGYDKTLLDYNSDNQITKIFYPNNTIESFEYDKKQSDNNFLITKHILPDGRTLNFYYTLFDFADVILIAMGETDKINSHERVTRFVYSNKRYGEVNTRFLRFIISPEGRVTEQRELKIGIIDTTRQYVAAKFTDFKLIPPAVPLDVEVMELWESKLTSAERSAISLSHDEFNLRGQTIQSLHYLTIDRHYNGVQDEHTQQSSYHWTPQGQMTVSRFRQLPLFDPMLKPETDFAYDNLQRQINKVNALNEKTIQHYQDNTPNQVVITRPNGRVETTINDANGYSIQEIISSSDATLSPRTTAYLRDAGGRLGIVVDAHGVRSYVYYDKQDRLALKIDALGYVTQYQFDTPNRITTTTHYAKPVDLITLNACRAPDYLLPPPISDVENQLSTLQAPIADRRTIEIKDGADQLRFSIDASNYVTELRYDAFNEIAVKIQYSRAFTEDEIATLNSDSQLAINIHTDKTWQYQRDDDGQLVRDIAPGGYVNDYERDNGHRITKKTQYHTPVSHFLTPNELKLLNPSPSAKDASTHYFYNVLNQMIAEIDPENYLSRHEYLPCDKLAKSTRYATRLPSNWSESHTLPEVASSTHDRIMAKEYDALNRDMKTIDSHSGITSLSYDSDDNIVCRTVQSEEKLQTFSGDNIRSHFKLFNSFNQLISECTPSSEILRRIYAINVDDKLTPDEKKSQQEVLWLTEATHYFYDEKGLKTATKNSLGHITYHYYDLAYRPALSVDPVGAIKQIHYNGFGEIEAEIAYATPFTTEEMRQFSGGLISQAILELINAKKNTGKDRVIQYVINKQGLVKEKQDSEGYVSRYQHNAFKNVIREQLPVNDKNPTLTIQHEFNVRGLKTSTIKTAGTETQVISAIYDNVFGKCTSATSALNEKTSYVQDKLGNTISIEDMSGIKRLSFDAFDKVQSQTNTLNEVTTFEHDEIKRTTIAYAPNRKSYTATTYNVFAETITQANTSGILDKWTHNTLGKPETHRDAVNQVTTFAYNTEGQLIRKTAANGLITTPTYNAANQLTLIAQSGDNKTISETFEPNVFGENAVVINKNGVKIQNTFNRIGYLVESTLDAKENGLNITTYYKRNANGKIVSEIIGNRDNQNQFQKIKQVDDFDRFTSEIIDPKQLVPATIAALEIKTSKQYDKLNQPITETDANNQSIYKFYNIHRQVSLEISPLGAVTEFTYDTEGKLTAKRAYHQSIHLEGLNPTVTLAAVTAMLTQNPEDKVTYRVHDNNARERFILTLLQDSENQTRACVTEYKYNSANQKTETIQYATEIDVSILPHMSLQEIEAAVSTHSSPKDRHCYGIYDTKNRERFLIKPNHAIVEQQFDSNDNPIVTIEYAKPAHDPALLLTLSLVDATRAITQLAEVLGDRKRLAIYNVFNHLEYEIDPEGAVTHYEYNNTQQCTKTCRFEQKVDLNQSYEAIKMEVRSWVVDRQKDNVIEKSYNASDRMITQTDPLNFVDKYKYDACDNETHRMDRNENIWKNEYDRANRRTCEKAPARSIAEIKLENNQLTLQRNATSTIAVAKEYCFDKASNETKVICAVNTNDSRTIDMEYNAHHVMTRSLIENVIVDDTTKIASHTSRPEKIITAEQKTIIDNFGQTIATCDASEFYTFSVFDNLGRERFTLTAITNNLEATFKVTEKKYDAFNQIATNIDYATPLVLKPNDYIPNGILYLNMVSKVAHLGSSADRITHFEYNLLGFETKATQEAIMYFQSHENHGIASPTVFKDYNIFGDKIAESVSLGLTEVSTQYWWHDKTRNIILECNSNNAMTHYQRNAYGLEETKTEYAIALTSSPSPFQPVTEVLSRVTKNAKDRQYTQSYNVRLEIVEVSQLSIEYHELTQEPITCIVSAKTTATTRKTYTPTGKLASITLPDGISKQSLFYDTCDNHIATQDAAFTTDTLSANPQLFHALHLYAVNAHGQRIAETHLSDGTHANIADANMLLNYLNPDLDQTQLTLFENRGLPIWHQDAENVLFATSYTPNRKMTREWHYFSNWQATNLILNMDETRTVTDGGGNTLTQEIRRDNTIVRQFSYQNNVFGECEIEYIDGKQIFVHRYDTQGSCWFTNENQGMPTLQLFNLNKAHTVKMESAAIHLGVITYAQLADMLLNQTGQIEKTIYERDNEDRIINQYSPACLPSLKSEGDFIPLQIQVNGSVLSWPFLQNIGMSPREFRVKQSGLETWQTLSITVVNDICSVTIPESWQTDIYEFIIPYYAAANPIGAIAAHSTGFIPVELTNQVTSQQVVVSTLDNFIVLKGNTARVLEIQLNSGTDSPIMLPVIRTAAEVKADISAQTSGYYTLTPKLNDNTFLQKSLPFTLKTQHKSNIPMVQEIIPCEMDLHTETLQANLTWQLPARYQHCDIDVELYYLDEDKIPVTEKVTLHADANQVFNHENPEWNITLPSKISTSLSVSIILKTDGLSIPLYKNQKPSVTRTYDGQWEHIPVYEEKSDSEDNWSFIEAETDEPENIQGYTFPEHQVVRIDNLIVAVADSLEVLDGSDNQFAEWKNLPILGMAEASTFVDGGLLPVGNYYFRLKGQTEKFLMKLEHHHLVYSQITDLALPDKPTIPPYRHFKPDRWANILESKDSLQNTTTREFNHNNDCIRELLPPIQVVDSADLVRPETRYFFNILNGQIAKQNPRLYFTYYLVNQANLRLATLMADNVWSRRSVYNVFKREIQYLDGSSKVWNSRFNRKNLQVYTCSPMGRVTKNSYNEVNLSLSQTVSDIITRFSHDAEKNLVARILANGNQYRMVYGMHHVKVQEILPNNEGSLSWAYDDFGVERYHTDLAGVTTEYVRDFKQQCVREYHVSGRHIQKYIRTDRRSYLASSGLYDKPIETKDIAYRYDAGRLSQVIDYVLRQITIFQSDTEDRHVQRTMTMFDGTVIANYTTGFNAAGNEVRLTDSSLQILSGIDVNGNRRSTTAIMANAQPRISNATFDPADRILQDGDVGYGYENGYRTHERRNGRDYQISYNDDGLLLESRADANHFISREYEPAQGVVAAITECDGKVVFRHEMKHDPITQNQTASNEFKASEQTAETTFYDQDSNGLALRQQTQFHDPNAADDTRNHYAVFESKQLNVITTIRSQDDDTVTSHSIDSFNSHGHIQNTRNGIGYDEDSVNYTEIQYIQTYQGLPLSVFTQNIQISDGGDDRSYSSKRDKLFYTTSNQPLGTFQVDGESLALSMSYGGNSQSGGSFFSPVTENSAIAAQTNKRGLAINTIQNMSVSFPPPMPETYVAKAGDSYESIAASLMIPDRANDIRLVNGWDTIEAGQIIKIPQYQINRNHAGDYQSYSKFINCIYQGISAQVAMPSPADPGFLSVLVPTLIAGIAAIVAPPLAVYAFGSIAAGATLTSAVAVGVTAGLTDAALQEVAVATGLQQKFSVNQVIETAVTAGVMQYDGILSNASAAEEALNKSAHMAYSALKSSVGSQLFEMSIGTRPKFDIRAVATAVATSYAGAKFAPRPLQTQSVLAQRFATSAFSSAMNTTISSLIYWQQPNARVFAIQALGSMASQEVGEEISHHIESRIQARNQVLTIEGVANGSNQRDNQPRPIDSSKVKLEKAAYEREMKRAHTRVSANDKGLSASENPGTDSNVNDPVLTARQSRLGRFQTQATPSRWQSFWDGVDLINGIGSSWTDAEVSSIHSLMHPVTTAQSLWNGAKNAATWLGDMGELTFAASDSNLYQEAAGRMSNRISHAKQILRNESQDLLSGNYSRIGHAFGDISLASASPGVAGISKLGIFSKTLARESAVNSISHAKLLGKYDAYNPGMLTNRRAKTFLGKKYETYQLKKDIVLYRVGNSDEHLGEFFTQTVPKSELQARIDQAILPKWPDGGSSLIDTGYAIRIPKGIVIHVGEIAPQNNIFLGGTQQIFIEKPWLIPGVKLVDKFTIKQELLWNLQARR